MADPKKPLDRARPFARIHNEAFIVAADAAPDGDGKACGCHTPDELDKDVEAEFRRQLDKHLPLPFFSILDTIDGIARKAKILADGIAIAVFSWLATTFPGIGTLVALATIITITNFIIGVIETIVRLTKAALRAYFETIGLELLRRALRMVPQWVPVKKGASDASAGADQIIEMEGVATRSFGNPCDAPFFQWHRWFDWNVQVTPADGYAHARSPANNPPNTSGAGASERPIARPKSFEIQIDPGILVGPERAAAFERGFDERAIEANDAVFVLPYSDWCWPQTGMWVWAAGRWVYDCSRVTEGATPRMCAMINPARALATARWRAARLPGQAHGLAVPVIQFMFIASTRGGYIDFDADTAQDYQFILDLPPATGTSSGAFAIGDTRRFPRNTIVLRHQLLRDVQPLWSGVEKIEPIIEPILGKSGVAEQVKVTVPVRSAGGRAERVGFLLSLGWHDGDGAQARRVKLCRLQLTGFSGRKQQRDGAVQKLRARYQTLERELRKAIKEAVDDLPLPLPPPFNVRIKDIPPLKAFVDKLVDDLVTALLNALQRLVTENEEWLLRLAANGVWRNHYEPAVRDAAGSQQVPFAKRPVSFPPIALGEDDELALSVSGLELDPVGDMMRLPHKERVLTDQSAGDAEVPWPRIVRPAGDDRAAKKKWQDLIFQYVFKVMAHSSGMGLDNEPLGLVEPDAATAGTEPATHNPLRMKGVAQGTFKIVRAAAGFARALPNQQILVEDPRKDDYTVYGTLTVERQPVDASELPAGKP